MDLIPHEEIIPRQNFNFAPMIDFLFLMLSFFATLAISRASLHDADIQLVQLKKEAGSELVHSTRHTQEINLSITSAGQYKWITEFQEYPMTNVLAIQKELSRQYQMGILPPEKTKTEILLHIDAKAPWQAIAQVIFGVKELGFSARPVYVPEEMQTLEAMPEPAKALPQPAPQAETN